MSEFNEPWTGEPDFCPNIIRSDGTRVIVEDAGGRELYGWEISDADLNRIVACVNFCRNLRTEWLEDHLAVENPPYPGRTDYMEPNKLRPVFETDKMKVRMRLEGE